ncbi:ABC transporter ATP-binding protein [Paenibacillus sp. EC2-1]|uniref:ABC transporter ATP-binding protein n=1 Tax=Paenibacillus sp. EC2-1 TaxID=3388665 RepID=UPI003BEF4348
MIQVQNLHKEYRQSKRYSGFWGVWRTLVTKEYTSINAVKNISFTLNQGESVGYLGPNGAGKSTMIKMLTGILVPTSGIVEVNGLDPCKHRLEVTKKIGIVFGQRSQLWWDIPVRDSFEIHKKIYKVSDSLYKDTLDMFIELLDMDFIDKPVRQLSLGQRMRAEIGLALIHNPDILFLDEPTIGLDVIAKDNVRGFLKQINTEKKVSILLTSHDLKDIEEVCPRLLIVNKGELIYDGSIRKLSSLGTEGKYITIEFYKDPGIIHYENVTEIANMGNKRTFKFKKDVNNIIDFIHNLSKEHVIVDFSLNDSDIEDVIRNYYNSLNSSKNNLVETERASLVSI